MVRDKRETLNYKLDVKKEKNRWTVWGGAGRALNNKTSFVIVSEVIFVFVTVTDFFFKDTNTRTFILNNSTCLCTSILSQVVPLQLFSPG